MIVSSLSRGMLSYITTGDHSLMRRVNRWRPPRWLRLWMMAATRGGDGWLWYAMGLLVALLGGSDRYRALAAAAVAVALGIALFLKLKRAFGRKRPCALEPHCWATLLPPDQFSFPSGHTITAFAMASSLGVYYPALLPGLRLNAFYDGDHVVGGAARERSVVTGRRLDAQISGIDCAAG